ncbi:YlbF family regulator [Lysinibacillus sp. NPDC097279]|uniref:YlbF family regulator n=1 Tax=unclassified Lysinibacillus TaxID=2636778 RepID=UPI001175222A|nr:YlbF family regulator [Lysinibacillus sp. CD3-6]QPQ34332.1 YlbF family regulator [Lysinibacillus sp. JNUCC-52]UED79710.1 YlbF family regulator [Lysinibacillus sp. CD3-6]
MVNIYNEINALEATFRKTEEFKALEEAVAVVKADEDAIKLFQNFRKIQIDLQQKQMAGEDLQEDELLYAQKTAQLAQQNEKIVAMLEAEMKLSGVIEEVNRILVKPIQSLYEGM